MRSLTNSLHNFIYGRLQRIMYLCSCVCVLSKKANTRIVVVLHVIRAVQCTLENKIRGQTFEVEKCPMCNFLQSNSARISFWRQQSTGQQVMRIIVVIILLLLGKSLNLRVLCHGGDSNPGQFASYAESLTISLRRFLLFSTAAYKVL